MRQLIFMVLAAFMLCSCTSTINLMDQSVRTVDQWNRTVNRIAAHAPNRRYVDPNNGARVNKSKTYDRVNFLDLGTLTLRVRYSGVEVKDYRNERYPVVFVERGTAAYNYDAYCEGYKYRVHVDAKSQNGSIYVSVYDGNLVVGRYRF